MTLDAEIYWVYAQQMHAFEVHYFEAPQGKMHKKARQQTTRPSDHAPKMTRKGLTGRCLIA